MPPVTSAFPWRLALVTGGAGFLGSHLCERLLDAGVAVHCADNLLTGRPENVAHLTGRAGFRFVECDLTAPGAPDALPGPYDLVLHFASPASPADYLAHPLETLDAGSAGTRNALAVAARDGARFLLASTSEVYGDPEVHPQTEDYWGHVNPIGPRSCYDESKRFAEALTTAHAATLGTDAGIVRLFNSYGPRMRAHDGRVVPAFVNQALAGEPLTVAGDGSQTRSLCYVNDTVDGVLTVAAARSLRPVNIGGTDEVTVLDLAREIIEATGSRSELTFVERPVDDPERRRPDLTLARELLGWRPRVPWTEGLKRTVEYFAAQSQPQPQPQSQSQSSSQPRPPARPEPAAPASDPAAAAF
jgi:dTDP-glucose 4,6-dehydratase